ncbi:conserved hypothetical protein [Xanthomonas citri pv. fuscans]|nr:conserved hypothetical protein [Xanthomonas citri pv. fuscans]
MHALAQFSDGGGRTDACGASGELPEAARRSGIACSASNEATLVRRRWLDADDARGRDVHAEADLGRIRLADARCLPADWVCSAVPGNADAANAHAAGALTLDQPRGDRPMRINWPRSADDRNRVRRCAGQSPTHLHGRAH